MTSPSSYLFYEDTNTSEHTVGTRFIRVSVTDSAIEAVRVEVVHISESRDVIEEILEKEIISCHENSKGEKYLKFHCLENGKLVDRSLYILSYSKIMYNSFTFMHDECAQLIERSIIGWFGESVAKNNEAVLYFPALIDIRFPTSENRRFAAMMLSLEESGIGIAEALRKSSSWASFLQILCPQTVKTSADVQLLTEYPFQLLTVAVKNLGRTISSFERKDLWVLLDLKPTFNYGDTQVLDFMLEHSSPTEREELLSLILNIVRTQKTKFYDPDSGIIPRPPQPSRISFDRIPSHLRQDLIQELKDSLKITYQALATKEVTRKTGDSAVVTDLISTLRYWYAEKVLAPELDRSTVTLEQVETRFHELFNVPLAGNSTCIRSFNVKETMICAFLSRTINADTERDIFANLNFILEADRPKDRGLYSSVSAANGFIDDDGMCIPLAGSVYLLEDILEIIEKGVAVVDKQLHNFGLVATPSNRTAFITTMTDERNFKESWNLYEWGITDPVKIKTLRRSRIFSKEEALMFNSLPDDMFFELLT